MQHDREQFIHDGSFPVDVKRIGFPQRLHVVGSDQVRQHRHPARVGKLTFDRLYPLNDVGFQKSAWPVTSSDQL
jgi:hypothetical protein